MKIKQIIEKERKELINNNIEDSLIIVRQIVCKVLNKDKQYLVINSEEEIGEEQGLEIDKYINKIISGTPIQYITNKQEFMGIDFYVDENVLIPQPDTEVLVENVIKICEKLKNNTKENTKDNFKNQSKKEIKILDLCTGSGAIAVSLDFILNKRNKISKEKKQINEKNSNRKNEEDTIIFKIYASDISKFALEVAKKNNKLNNCDVTFIKSNLFEEINEKEFDIIVSNPPYIRTDVIKNDLSIFVQNEPSLALDGGQDGLYFYRNIINNSCKYLNSNAYLCLEIGYDQKEDVINILNESNKFSDIVSTKDLSNNDRCVIAKLK